MKTNRKRLFILVPGILFGMMPFIAWSGKNEQTGQTDSLRKNLTSEPHDTIKVRTHILLAKRLIPGKKTTN